MIEKIYACLPKGYDLVLKSHPHVREDISIQKITRKLIDCYLYFDSPTTEELISSSSIVISAGTSAGVEALIQNKHVIELGDRPPYFNFDNPPVVRVKKIDDLNKQIKSSLVNDVPIEKIYSYFTALLKCSSAYSNIGKNDHKISLDRTKEFYIKAAKVLYSHMSK